MRASRVREILIRALYNGRLMGDPFPPNGCPPPANFHVPLNGFRTSTGTHFLSKLRLRHFIQLSLNVTCSPSVNCRNIGLIRIGKTGDGTG